MVALCGSMRSGRCSGLDRWTRTSLHTLTRVSRCVFFCNCNPSVLLFSMDMHRRKVVDLHAIQGSANLSNSIVIFIQCRPPLQLMRGKRSIFFTSDPVQCYRREHGEDFLGFIRQTCPRKCQPSTAQVHKYWTSSPLFKTFQFKLLSICILLQNPSTEGIHLGILVCSNH